MAELRIAPEPDTTDDQFVTTLTELAEVMTTLAEAVAGLRATLAVGSPELLRPAEAAAFCGVSLTKFNEVVALPNGPTKRTFGGVPVYRRSELVKYLDKLKEHK